MILEVVRSITDWLQDGTNGVAAQLALLPLDAGDSAPSVGTIADETRSNIVAQGRLPSTPGIAVNSQGIKELDPEVTTVERDGQITLHVRVGCASADTKNATRDGSYILRAIVRSLRLYNAATRTRNSIAIYSCIDLRLAALWQPIDDQIITGAVIGTWQFRDIAP